MSILISVITVVTSLSLTVWIYLHVRKYVAELGKSKGKDAFIKDRILK